MSTRSRSWVFGMRTMHVILGGVPVAQVGNGSLNRGIVWHVDVCTWWLRLVPLWWSANDTVQKSIKITANKIGRQLPMNRDAVGGCCYLLEWNEHEHDDERPYRGSIVLLHHQRLNHGIHGTCCVYLNANHNATKCRNSWFWLVKFRIVASLKQFHRWSSWTSSIDARNTRIVIWRQCYPVRKFSFCTAESMVPFWLAIYGQLPRTPSTVRHERKENWELIPKFDFNKFMRPNRTCEIHWSPVCTQ